jgi:hypothetical protein
MDEMAPVDKVVDAVETVEAKPFLPMVLQRIWRCQVKMALMPMMVMRGMMHAVVGSREMLTVTSMRLTEGKVGMGVMGVMEVMGVHWRYIIPIPQTWNKSSCEHQGEGEDKPVAEHGVVGVAIVKIEAGSDKRARELQGVPIIVAQLVSFLAQTVGMVLMVEMGAMEEMVALAA